MRRQGLVQAVYSLRIGSELDVDTQATDTTLTVSSSSFFSDSGGYLTIEGSSTIFTYTTADFNAQTVTLAAAVGAVFPAGSEVTVYPSAREKRAMVQVTGNDDAAADVLVPHEFDALFLEGIRTPDSQESVEIAVVSDRYEIAALLGKRAQIQGEAVTAAGLPWPVATAAPTTSPSPAPVPGPFGVFVTWPPVAAGTQVDVHLSGSGLGATSAATLAASDSSSPFFAGALPDGTKLNPDIPIYVALVARNEAGEAPASAWVETRAGVPGPDIISRVVSASNVVADQVQTSGVRVGNIAIGPAPSGVDIPGMLHIPQAPTTDDPAWLRGDAVLERATLLSAEIKAGVVRGAVQVSEVPTAPHAPPRVSAYWPAWLRVWLADGTSNLRGLWWDAAASLWTACDPVTRTIIRWTGDGVWVSTWTVPGLAPYGAVKWGGGWYVVAAKADGSWVLATFDPVSQTVTGSASLGTLVSGITGSCAIGLDAVNDRLLVAAPIGTTLKIRSWAAGFASSTTTSFPSWPSPTSLAGNDCTSVMTETADFGAARVVASTRDQVRVWDTAAARVTSHEWAPPAGEPVLGIAWLAGFMWSLTGPAIWLLPGVVTSFTESWTYTFYDSDAAGGTHESLPSAATVFTRPTRTLSRVDVDPPPDSGGVDDPDTVRVYYNNSARVTLAAGVTSTDAVAMLGGEFATAPTTNGFVGAVGTTGSLSSSNSVWNLVGDGSGSAGPYKWTSTGKALSCATWTISVSRASGTAYAALGGATLDTNSTAGITFSETNYVVSEAGFYEVFAWLSFPASATGNRRIMFEVANTTSVAFLSGTKVAEFAKAAEASGTTELALSACVYIPASGCVRIGAWQNSGAAQTLTGRVSIRKTG